MAATGRDSERRLNLILYPCALIFGYSQDFSHIRWSMILGMRILNNHAQRGRLMLTLSTLMALSLTAFVRIDSLNDCSETDWLISRPTKSEMLGVAEVTKIVTLQVSSSESLRDPRPKHDSAQSHV